MRSSRPSEVPDEWKQSSHDLRFMVAIGAILAAAATAVLFGAAIALAGNLWGLVYSTLFAILMLLVAALGVAIRIQRRDLVTAIGTVRAAGSPATEIRYSRRQFALLLTLMTSLAVTCVAGAVHLVLLNHKGISVPSVVMAGFGLLGASFSASALLGRVRRGGLTLSDAVIWQRGWSFESSLRWSDVAGVKAAFNGHPVILLIGYANADWTPRYTTRLWRIDRLPPVPMIEVDCRRFDVDSHALLDYLAGYAEDPGLRPELGTPAAISRAQRTGTAA